MLDKCQTRHPVENSRSWFTATPTHTMSPTASAMPMPVFSGPPLEARDMVSAGHGDAGHEDENVYNIYQRALKGTSLQSPQTPASSNASGHISERTPSLEEFMKIVKTAKRIKRRQDRRTEDGEDRTASGTSVSSWSIDSDTDSIVQKRNIDRMLEHWADAAPPDSDYISDHSEGWCDKVAENGTTSAEAPQAAEKIPPMPTRLVPMATAQPQGETAVENKTDGEKDAENMTDGDIAPVASGRRTPGATSYATADSGTAVPAVALSDHDGEQQQGELQDEYEPKYPYGWYSPHNGYQVLSVDEGTITFNNITEAMNIVREITSATIVRFPPSPGPGREYKCYEFICKGSDVGNLTIGFTARKTNSDDSWLTRNRHRMYIKGLRTEFHETGATAEMMNRLRVLYGN